MTTTLRRAPQVRRLLLGVRRRSAVLALVGCLVLVPGVHATITDPLAWWTFDEAAGDLLDQSGHGYTGTVTGSPTRGAAAIPQHSLGNAFTFSGTGQYVTIATESAFDFVESTFSVVGWFSTSATAASPMVLAGKASNGSDWQWQVFIGTSNKLVAALVACDGTDVYAKISTATVNDGAWHHFAAVVTTAVASEMVTLYLDGVEQTTVASDARATQDYCTTGAGAVLLAGVWSTAPTRLYTGRLDEVRVWGRGLSAAEVQEHYAYGATTAQLAFPTAEGFGRFSQGGRGGAVVYITRLDGNTAGEGYAPGNGSLRACLEATGPRTCIFRVGGIIDFPPHTEYLNAFPPYVTIAGQTAPGDGILLKNFQLAPRDTHDIIVRHIRSRPGDLPHGQGGSMGAFEVSSTGTETYNIIFDHVSGGWAQDDQFSVENAHDITMQWSIISEGLGNGPGDPSKVTLVSAGADRVSLLHNLWTDMGYRVPQIQAGTVQVVNNIAYNIAGTGYVWAYWGVLHAAFVNNYYKTGPSVSQADGTQVATLGCMYGTGYSCADMNASAVYVSGNYHNLHRPSNSQPETDWIGQQCCPSVPISSTPFSLPVIPSQTSAQQALTDVLAKAGTTVPRRDSIDARAVSNVTNNTTLGFDTETVATYGGYPTYTSGTPYTDTDGDGISDSWETAHGLNPAEASDGPLIGASGYSNLELFLNELAGDPPLTTTPTPFRLRLVQ